MERACLPGAGSCSAMFTANTMSSAVEAMGLSLPGSASHPAAASPEPYCLTANPIKLTDADAAIQALLKLMKAGIRSRDIVTRDAIENSVRFFFFFSLRRELQSLNINCMWGWWLPGDGYICFRR